MQKKKFTILSVICVIIILAAILLSSCTTTSTPTTSQPTTSTSTTSPAAAKDKIIIGMPSELSGPLAVIRASAFQPVLDAWLADVNGAGGLNIGGKKMPIEMKIYDDKSDPPTAAQLLEKLIVQDKVDFTFPAGGTSFIFACAPIANKYGYIYSAMEGGASQLKEILPGLPYVFVNLSFSDWYQMPVLADVLSAKGVKTAYIVYIADLHGIEYSGVAGIELPKKGISIIGSKSLPPEMKDFSLVIKEAKAANPDAFLCFAYPDQNMPVTAEMMAQSFNPKFFMTGPTANFGWYHTTFKGAVEGVGCWASWSDKISPELKALADKLYAGKPEDVQDWWGQSFYWAGLQFFQQAVEKAGTLDQKVIRDIMATSHFQTVLGDTYYTNGLMAKESHPGEVGQWQNGKIEIVGGNKTTASLVYPKPAWPAP
jgi:branched-chain amino acid transport system substrate-binding protein